MKNFNLFLLFCLLLMSVMLYSEARGMSPGYVNNAFKTVAAQQGVDEKVLRAICWVESRHSPYSYNHGDGGPDNHAFGACQVLYSTAKSFGLNDPNCEQDFRDYKPGDRNYKACKLFGPKTNITYAAKLLKFLMKRNDNNLYRTVVSYNAGSYRICRDGWLKYQGKLFIRCIKGGPINLHYLLKVYEAMRDGR